MKHKPIVNKRIGAQFKQRVTINKHSLSESDSLSFSSRDEKDDNQHNKDQSNFEETQNSTPTCLKSDAERQKIFQDFLNICDDTPDYETTWS